MILQHLRIARPVSLLSRSCELYTRGLGLTLQGQFTDHDGFSGCMLGREGAGWHLEFTQCDSHPLLPSPTVEDLLVLYIADKNGWEAACASMDRAGFIRVPSCNPYWDKKGVTFGDHDRYRVVIQNGHWGSA